MSSGLATKLQIKLGARLVLDGAPEAVAESLVTDGVVLVAVGAPCDAVLAFCFGPADVARVCEKLLDCLKPDGLLWFAYRKGTVGKASGLTRDTGWDPLLRAGYTTVRSIAIDDAWTGLRFRNEALVRRG